MYWLSFSQVVIGIVIYQLAQKTVPKDLNPFLFVAIAYLLGAFACIVIYVASKHSGLLSVETVPELLQSSHSESESHLGNLRRMLKPAAVLALGATLIELGYFLAYKHGWQIQSLPTIVLIAVSITLTLVGLVWFNETLTVLKTLGLSFCIGGLYLLLLSQ